MFTMIGDCPQAGTFIGRHRFLALERADGPFEDHQQTLAAGIDHPGLLESGQHVRCPRQGHAAWE